MFIFDFFRKRGCVGSAQLISDYFKLEFEEVIEELYPHYQSDYSVIDFIEKFNIDMEFSFDDETFIVCRHAMTTYDELHYLKRYGLLNLKQMLERRTPLSKFLQENDIKINVSRKTLCYKNSYYPILHRDEKCSNCIFGEYQCRNYFNNNLPDYKRCKYRAKMDRLHGKLYYDKCETEVFIDGTIADIYDYDSIRYSPEILSTIQNVTYFYENSSKSLKSKWSDIPNNKYYILEFIVNITDFEYYCSRVMYESYLDICDILEKFRYDEYDYMHDKVSVNFYKNMFILRRLTNNFIWGNDEKYGQILPSTIIKGGSIKIIRAHNVNDRVEEDRWLDKKD